MAPAPLLLVLVLCLVGALAIGPTSGSLSLNFRFSGTGHSSGGLLTYNITNNYGVLNIRGQTYTTVAYYTQGSAFAMNYLSAAVMGWPNPPGTVRWIDLLGVSTKGNNLAVVYLGLPPTKPNSVFIVWEEDFTHQITDDGSGIGSPCTFVDLAGKPNYQFPVSLPALTALPSAGIDTGITIEGDEIQLHRTAGWMNVGGTNYSVTPISTVVCTTCGSNCPVGCLHSPWWELHFIYSSPASTGFGIYYIYPHNRTFVQLNYTLSLPKLATPAITYAANWSGTVPQSIDWSQRAPFVVNGLDR